MRSGNQSVLATSSKFFGQLVFAFLFGASGEPFGVGTKYPDALSLVVSSGVVSGYNAPLSIIPHLGKLSEYVPEVGRKGDAFFTAAPFFPKKCTVNPLNPDALFRSGEKPRHVFQEDVGRSYLAYDADGVRPAIARIVFSEAETGRGERLAGESGRDNETVTNFAQTSNEPPCLIIAFSETANVTPDGGVIQRAVCNSRFKHLNRRWLVFDVTDGCPEFEPLAGKFSAACSGKQSDVVEMFNLGKCIHAIILIPRNVPVVG